MTVIAAHEAIASYRDYLGRRAELVQTFAIDALDHLGIPVWNATAWSSSPAHGVGYGERPEQAELGALGEAAEGLAATRFAETASVVELSVAEAMQLGGVHPARLSLVAGTRLDDAAPLLWVEAYTWPGGERRLLPLEAAVTSVDEFARAAAAFPDRSPLFPPITNGLGAGGSRDRQRAVRHGLLELVQRDLNWSQFKALDTARTIDVAQVAPEIAQTLSAAGLDLRLKYSGQTLGVHALHCAAVDRGGRTVPIARSATGEGADPDPVFAGRKAILEMCASRCRKRFFFGGEAALAVAPPEYRQRARRVARTQARELGWDLVARFDELLRDGGTLDSVVERITAVGDVVPLPPACDRDEPWDGLAAAGREAIVVALTSVEEPAQVVKVVVPGLEAEVLSHHRLSARGVRRLAQRCPPLVRCCAKTPGPGWRRVVADGEPSWVNIVAMEEIAAPFLPLYREPDRHAYAMP
jgi:YcaO-like protein with predicted kinase domain